MLAPARKRILRKLVVPAQAGIQDWAPAYAGATGRSFVYRGLRIHQQRDDVLDLLLGQDLLLAEARHVRARRERGRVVDLAVGVLLHLRREAAQLAEVVERRSDGAERELRLPELVARVAIRARGNGGVLAVIHPRSPLRPPPLLLSARAQTSQRLGTV